MEEGARLQMWSLSASFSRTGWWLRLNEPWGMQWPAGHRPRPAPTLPLLLDVPWCSCPGVTYPPSTHLVVKFSLSFRGSNPSFSSVTQLCPTLFDPVNRSMPGLPVHHQLLELNQTHAHRVGDAIQPSHLLSSPSPPAPQSLPASGSFPMSQLCIRWPKYWSFSFSISPSNEHPGLFLFRMDWLDLLAVQGTLKSLRQHHSSLGQLLLESWHLVKKDRSKCLKLNDKQIKMVH